MSERISTRHQSIPVLYTRGTHFEVGLDMGRTFSGMIKEFLQVSSVLNQSLLPAYSTAEGKKLYDESLATVKASFPQYISELEGIAQGAEVEFPKLFLLHLGDLLLQYIAMTTFKDNIKCISKASAPAEASVPTEASTPTEAPTNTGCLNIIVNNYYNRYIAHTQDASKDMLNYSYFVVAHIVNEEPQGKYQVTEEKFISLCYAGHLPGFTMASNHHGLVYAVNKLMPCTVGIGKTPPHFLGRALLSAQNMEQVELILNDEGLGAADGFSLSMASINDRLRKCFIIEVAPAIIGAVNSLISIVEVRAGSYAAQANMYLELEVDEAPNEFFNSSCARLDVVASYDPPKTKERILHIMNDEKLFLQATDDNQTTETVVLGIFDLSERTLAVYVNRPKESEPLLVIPLNLKSNCRVFES